MTAAAVMLSTVAVSASSTQTYSIGIPSYPGLSLRHCAFQLYATTEEHSGPKGDYFWRSVPALNGDPVAISYQSLDFPTKHMMAVHADGKVEEGRLILDVPSSAELSSASFTVVAGLGNASLASLKLTQGPFAGKYVTLSKQLQGTCSRQYSVAKHEGDIVMTDGSDKLAASWKLTTATPPAPGPNPTPPGPTAFTVDLGNVTHTISNLSMGCHSDSGYAHQARGFYSQMIVGDSFDATGYPDGKWNTEVDAGANFTASQASGDDSRFYGTQSELFSFTPSPAVAAGGTGGLSNRGLGNAGMVLESGKEYEGFIFAKVPSGGEAMTITASLEDYVTKTVLATQQIMIPVSTEFERFNISLTPSASTGCVDINPADEPGISCGAGRPRSPIGHTCVKCGGQFKLALSAKGAVLVNYVFLEPGQWGRVPGLSVLASAAKTLRSMGIKAIRQGGSYASTAEGSSEYYQWQKWTGPQWTRPSRTAGVWRSCLLAGWGPFEMIDMCNALNIEPVITTTESSTPESFADLVEYCWGNESTKMGAKRAADGHPDTYRVKYWELGNEQYNTNYVEQVTAMENKATELGMPKTLYYMFPNNHFLNAEDLGKAAQLNPRIDGHLVADVHIGGGGAVEAARALFASNTSFRMGAVNAETNAGTHVFSRAMSEAFDLNDWFNAADVADRLHFRASSFCMGESNDFDAWDQGISFFLPNMTWLQPPGYVHQMIDQTWQPNALAFFTASSSGDGHPEGIFSAQKSDDGKVVVLRYVNYVATSVNVTVSFAQSEVRVRDGTANVWTLASTDPDAANTPGNPTSISPKQSSVAFNAGSPFTVDPSSYTIVVVPIA